MQDCLYPNRHSQEVCAHILHSYYGCRWSVVANTCCTHWSQADSWISRPHKFSWLVWETGITVQDKRLLPFPVPSPSNWQLRSGDVGIESPGIPCYCSPCCTSEMCRSFLFAEGELSANHSVFMPELQGIGSQELATTESHLQSFLY